MITINDLLALPRLSSLCVAAGTDGLNRNVRAVSVMDAPDSHKWLKGGELILTSAYLFGNDDKIMELSLTNMIDAGSSGLGIKKGRFLPEIPPRVLSLAERHKFPILLVPYTFGYSEIISAFYERLYYTSENTQTPISEEQIDQLYNAGQLCAGRLMQMMTELSSVPMAVLRSDKSVITDNGLMGVGIIKDAIAAGLPPNIENRFFEIFKLPYLYHGQNEYLAVLTRNGGFLTETRDVINYLTKRYNNDHAAISKEETCQKLAQRLLLNMAAAEHIIEAQEFYKNEEAYTCAIIIRSNASETYTKILDTLHRARRVNKHRFTFYAACGELSQAIVIIEQNTADIPLTLFNDIEDTLCDEEEAFAAAGGLYKGIKNIDNSYNEALKALSTGRIIWRGKRFLTYQTLSLYARLAEHNITDSDVSAADMLEEAGKKLSWDAVTTTEAFIEYGSYKKAAEKLFMHENTLRYRIQKLIDATGIDINDNFTACALLAQIKARRLREGGL